MRANPWGQRVPEKRVCLTRLCLFNWTSWLGLVDVRAWRSPRPFAPWYPFIEVRAGRLGRRWAGADFLPGYWRYSIRLNARLPVPRRSALELSQRWLARVPSHPVSLLFIKVDNNVIKSPHEPHGSGSEAEGAFHAPQIPDPARRRSASSEAIAIPRPRSSWTPSDRFFPRAPFACRAVRSADVGRRTPRRRR
jgi:hypothetical protein